MLSIPHIQRWPRIFAAEDSALAVRGILSTVDNVVTDYAVVTIRMPLRYRISPVPPDGINCWLDSADRSTIPCLTQELRGARRRTTACSLFTAGPIKKMLWFVRALACDERRDFEQRWRGAEISKF
jgi:hypothetical protein